MVKHMRNFNGKVYHKDNTHYGSKEGKGMELHRWDMNKQYNTIIDKDKEGYFLWVRKKTKKEKI